MLVSRPSIARVASIVVTICSRLPDMHYSTLWLFLTVRLGFGSEGLQAL
jgi:hypothetical protein